MRDLEASRCTWMDKLSVLLRCLCKVLIDLKDVERIRNRYIISQFISPFISISFAYYVRVFVIIFVKNIMRKTQIKYPLSHARTYTHAYTRTLTYTRTHTHARAHTHTRTDPHQELNQRNSTRKLKQSHHAKR